MPKVFLITFFSVVFVSVLSGQCPDKTVIWNRITFLRDSSHVSAGDQLKELNSYLQKFSNCPIKNDSVFALLLVRVGWLYFQQKDLKNAVLFSNRGIDLINSNVNNPGINQSHLIRYYNNLQILYDSTGERKLRKRAIDSCISLSVRLKAGYRFSAQHISEEVEILFEKGDYYNCIHLANIGEEICRNAGFRPEDLFYYLSWKINALYFLKRYEEASMLTEKSVSECIQSGNKKYLGNMLSLRATIAEKIGSTENALKYAMQSFQYEKKFGYNQGCASTLNNLALQLYFTKLHQNDKALYYFKEALKYANAADSIYILNNIANLYVQNGNFNLAFDYFQKAFNNIYPNTNEKFFLNNSTTDQLNNMNVEYLITLILDKAEAYIKKFKFSNNLNDIQSALNIYKTADRLMDKIKVSQTDLSSKLFWRSDNRRLYERAIESCYLSDNMEDAFYFFEKSRAVLLNDQLNEQATGDPVFIKMSLVKRKILEIEKRSAELDPSTTKFSEVQRDLFIHKDELNRLDQLVKENNPWYYQSLIDTNFISLPEIQTVLIKNQGSQAILEFFNGDSAVYLFTIKADKSNITRIIKKDFEDKVDTYTSYLSDPSRENNDYNGFFNSSRQLYNLIFQKSPLPKGRIIVSPDGKYFPFEALITNEQVSAPDYFLNDHIVSYTYSVRFLLNDFSKNSISTAGNFLGVAPVHYPEALRLASLSQSDVSLEKISSRISHSKTLVSLNASRNNFMQQFPSYKIIQLYTHAADSSSQGEPVIYFSDSSLYLSELIPEGRTAAQLIVLSACETGNGKLYKGEGVFSFNRGFAAMGIPSSVTNLWSVDNESTYKITELFYKYVEKGLPLDLALQKAKLDFIATSSKEKRLPYYWAAAILVGKTDAIETGANLDWKWIALTVGMLLTCLAFFIIRRRKNISL